MERRVTFYADQDNDPADFNNLQDFVGGSFDHLVLDAIADDRRYAGFAAVATGVTTLTVQPGRFYSGGKVYARAEPFTKDFTTTLPVATRKIVSLVVFGSEVATDQRPREFLINEETGASEARVVPMELARVANVNTVAGPENADPTPPIVDAGVLVIAEIVLTPAGIQSVTMNADNALPSLRQLEARARTVERFKEEAAPQIVALGSDLAALRNGQADMVSGASYGRMLERVAVIEARSGIPSGAVSSSADFFLDGSLTEAGGTTAAIAEGLRFADDAGETAPLAVFDGLNPRAKINGGVLFPAYTREKRMAVGPRTGEVQASAYSYQSHEMVQRTMSRRRVRYGRYWTGRNDWWWRTGGYDYYRQTLARVGEALTPAIMTAIYNSIRDPHFWYDTVQETYWDQITVDHAVNGAQVAETFLNANDQWLDAIGLTFTRLANAGTVTVAVCETDRGMPDLAKVRSVTTVDRAQLLLNAETVIPIQPTFLEGGTRYAIVVITAADHWLATTQGENFTQGTFFYILDGAYQQGDGSRDLCFSLYAAKFKAARAVIELQPLSLAGGIASIDVLAATIVPGSTDLTYEIQVNNAWVPLAAGGEAVLGAGGNVPPLVPLRAVFTGTPDVMPAITLTGSTVRISRSKLTLTQISTQRTLPAPSTQIRVIARFEEFDAAHHTATAKLLTGAGFATEVSASSFTDAAAGNGVIERTWLFNLGAAVSTYKVKLGGTTDSALAPFHFAWRKDFAL